ncbi:hypothetical protein GWK47_019066 [Chionoecetes opilio]|uniref:Uncharacterized protein n=1 Tax=Chionoecetes opilio TaxID=41210 RepID=A0A8J4XQ60_CHIOP|nr:hypothetical protein GWK47_019066 [Chionoecetes opilio]
MSSVNSFMARMEGHLTSGSHSPTPRRRRSPSPASLSPVPPSESVVVEDDYLVCSDGEEDAALPVPKRRRFGDFRPLASCPPGPYSAISSEVPSRCTSPRPAAEDALGLPPSSSVLFTWAPMPPSIACETVDGRLVAIGRLEDGSWGPVPDLEVRRSRVDGGKESFLYRRIPFSRLNAPSKQPAVSSAAAFDALASLLAEPSLVRDGFPCVEGSQDARWLSLGGQERLPWMKAGLDPAEVWRAGTTSVNRGPSQSWAPIPVLPASGGFPRVIADFLRVSRFSAKDLPWRAQPVKEELFRRDFQERQHASLLTSSVAFFGQLAEWLSSLAVDHSSLSSASRSDVCRALSTACDAFGASLLPTVRPALDRAVTARLALRREAFRGLPELTRQQILRISPFDSEVLSEPSLQQCLASIPPTVTLVSSPAPRPSRPGGSGRGSGSVRRGSSRREGQSRSAHPRVDGPQDPRRPSRGGPSGFRGSGSRAFRSGPATVHKPSSKGRSRF